MPHHNGHSNTSLCWENTKEEGRCAPGARPLGVHAPLFLTYTIWNRWPQLPPGTEDILRCSPTPSGSSFPAHHHPGAAIARKLLENKSMNRPGCLTAGPVAGERSYNQWENLPAFSSVLAFCTEHGPRAPVGGKSRSPVNFQLGFTGAWICLGGPPWRGRARPTKVRAAGTV